MSTRFNFTKKDLEKLAAPTSGKQVYYYDSQVRRLALSVARGGTKTFFYCRKIDKVTRRRMLGYFPEMTIEQARECATKCSVGLLDGNSPFETPVSVDTDITFETLFDKYINDYAKIHTRTWRESVANFRRHFSKWKHRKTMSIQRIEVQSWVNVLAAERGKYCANRNYDLLRAVISWGIRKEIISHRNPCLGVDKYKVKARQRFVQPGDELARLLESIDAEPDDTLRDFFWMCLFTGARKSNVLGMRWDQINFDLKLWTIPDTKNGDSHIVNLVDESLRILRRRKESASNDWVFPSPRRIGPLRCPKAAWDRITRRANIEDLRIHDLRRTLGSYMAIQGTSSTIIGKALGHKSVAATAIYSRLTQNPVREAVEGALNRLFQQ